MKNETIKGRLLRSSILAGVAVSMVSVAAPAFAQEDGIEEIFVTGSRIARNEFTSASPISVFNTEDLNNAGVTSIDEFLQDIPAFTGFQLGATTNNGNDGAKQVDMRGLESKRTLVLINGRRQVGSTTADGAVDLNTIPMGMIERIEVLKDGASTIYGSDALAGVVNIILKKDFEGAEIAVDYGAATGDWDAQNVSISGMAGVASDRGSAMFSAQYSRQDEIKQDARGWSHDALYSLLDGEGNFAPVASGSSNSRKIGIITGAGEAVGGSYIVDETTGLPRKFSGATDTYNYAPVNALVTPNERWAFGGTANYDLWENTALGDISGYVEGMYTKRTSHQRLAPDASFSVTDDFPGNLSGEINSFVPASNPFNPFGDSAVLGDFDFGTLADAIIWGDDEILGTADDLTAADLLGRDVKLNRRFDESGGRLYDQENDTFRIVAGFSGDTDSNMHWDVSYVFADTQQVDGYDFLHRFDRWQTIVDPALCAADAACTAATAVDAFDPFAPFGSLTSDHFDYLMASGMKDKFNSRLQMWQANLSGDTDGIIELPAGPIGWALNYEAREESVDYSPDAFIGEGLTTGGAADPLQGTVEVKEYAVEFLAPILDNLSAEASARHSNYTNDFGEFKATTYRIGVDYAPIEDLRVRAVLSTGFRAPNITELYAQDQTGFPIIEPLCEFADRRLAVGDINQTVWDNCDAAIGVTDDTTEMGFAWQTAYTLSSDPADLEPEESTTFTVGAIITPRDIPQLQVSIDYWNIEIDGWIGATPLNDLYRQCLESVGLSADSCTDNFTDGINAYGWVYPPETAEGVRGNLGKVSTDGFDVSARWDQDVDYGIIDRIDADLAFTLVNSREEEWPGIATRDLVGTANGFAVYPELRANTSIGFHQGDAWSVFWKTQYIGETDDLFRHPEMTDDAVAEDTWYNDLVGTVHNGQYTITIGVNNILDQDPPRFHSAFNANTEPGMYDVLGRRFFARMSASF